MTPNVAMPCRRKSRGRDFNVASSISNRPYPSVIAGVIRWREVSGPSHSVAEEGGACWYDVQTQIRLRYPESMAWRREYHRIPHFS